MKLYIDTKAIEAAPGKSLLDLIRELGMVAEGVKSTESVSRLAQLKQVEMPVTNAVYEILYGNLDPYEAVKRLFARSPKEERVC